MSYLVASGLLDPDPDCFVRLLELDVLSWGYIKKTMNHIKTTYTSSLKASVTIIADFSPEFNPPFRWRSKHQTKNDC